MMRRFFIYYFILLILSFSTLLYSQSDDEKKRLAKEHFKKGLVLLTQENWEGALVEFEESLRLYPTKSALFNKAMCLKALHRYLEALSAFKQYLEAYGDEIDEVRKNEVLKSIAEIESLLGKLDVKVNVDGAKIYIDDKQVGISPMKVSLLLPPGIHKLKVVADGYEPYATEIEIVSEKTKEIVVNLKEVKKTAILKVTSNIDGAKVIIDGKEEGTTPLIKEIEEGEHLIEIKYKGYKSFSRKVILEAGKEKEISVIMEKSEVIPKKEVVKKEKVEKEKKGIHKGVFWTTTSITIASTLATIALGSTVVVLDSRYDPRSETAQEDYDRGHTLMLATDITLGVAIASGIASLILFFFTDWGKKETSKEKSKVTTSFIRYTTSY